jgi:hypothetical protein
MSDGFSEQRARILANLQIGNPDARFAVFSNPISDEPGWKITVANRGGEFAEAIWLTESETLLQSVDVPHNAITALVRIPAKSTDDQRLATLIRAAVSNDEPVLKLLRYLPFWNGTAFHFLNFDEWPGMTVVKLTKIGSGLWEALAQWHPTESEYTKGLGQTAEAAILNAAYVALNDELEK